MEVVNENLKVSKVAYRTKCKFCDINIELEGKDLKPGPQPMTARWTCPICGYSQTVLLPKLKSNKVIYYDVIE